MATSFSKIPNADVLYHFIHHCVDELVAQTNTSFNFDEVEWAKEDQTAAKNFIQHLYKANISNHSQELTLNHLNLAPQLARQIEECYNIRRNDIFQVVLRDEVRKGSKDVVENIDWKLKWIMGSSKLDTLREPFLQVDLHCFKKQNDVRNTFNFEMNLDQVNRLIHDLEQALVAYQS
ncbi:hypothetical protein PPYR_11512 [Photinus pyralis]|uniref:COMM domain-containing protein n=1 Tax=Photinus pyralis TaxID=7054 RepID=A0A1Y1L9K7_PHOPY|nr:uncharacterized protein LOC116176444 [Photinus pyralis]KAB0794673.1 hypothetical protein PPYR_11512 [Photinus pyralis]